MNDPIDILIYCLDDNKQDLELMQREFDRQHVLNYKFYTSEELFMNEFTKKVGMAVIDLILGSGISGIDVLKKVYKINPYCYNIVVSGFANPDTVINLKRNYHANEFVNKNNDGYLHELMGVIRKAIPYVKAKTEFINEHLS